MKNFMKTILSAVQTWTGGKIKDSTADWNQNDESADNYVKNRTHWEEIKEVAFLSETALNNFEQWEDGIYGSAFNYSQKLTVGQSYTVVWDGVQYNNLVCYNDGVDCLIIGAPYGDFSKYNFGIDYFEPDGSLEFYTNSTEAFHTISISATKTVVHKLDSKYIKDMYYEEDNRSTIYLEEITIDGFTDDSSGIYKAPLFDSPLSVNGQFEVGKLYNVMWDGTEYLVEFCETEGGYYFGHDYYVSGWETDLPFGVWVNLDGTIGALSSNSDENRHNLSIYEGSYKIHKIDSKYLPTNLATAEDVRIVKQEAIDVANTAQDTADTAQTTADSKMDATNPVCTGSFSMNRLSGTTIGSNSVAVGWKTKASGFASYAEGSDTIASGTDSHAEGYLTKAIGFYSHAEGLSTSTDPDSTPSVSEYTISYQRKGLESHAEGYGTVAGGTSSHAEGNGTLSSGYVSHAEGIGTIADSIYQHAQGKFNIKDSADTYAHIVGNGTSDTARSNAHTLDWNGVGWFQGGLQVGGTAQDGEGVGYVPAVPAGATVGQLLAVKAVDENGKPTEWGLVTISLTTDENGVMGITMT